MKNRLIYPVMVLVAAILFTGVAVTNAEVSNGDDDIVAPISNPSGGPTEVTNGDDDIVTPAPQGMSSGTIVTNGDDDFVVITSTPNTGSAVVTNGEDDIVTPPAPQGGSSGTIVTNGEDDIVTPPAPQGGSSGTIVTNNDDDAVVTPPVTPVDPETPSNTSSGGRRSRSLVKVVATSTATTSPVTASTSCPVLTSYLKLGWNNDVAQVKALQSFFKNVEKMDISVTGIFDAQTESAVMVFQKKYLETVLGPWHATIPSGVVYITTLKKINQIGCGSALTLTGEELNTIASYKAPVDGEATGEVGAIAPVLGASNATGTLDVTLASVENTAAAGDTSLAKKFWNFITGLFR